MIKTLLFSTLYPNSVQCTKGIFVENRLRQLLVTDEVEAKVIAPVPWFPFRASVFGKYAEFAKVPCQEIRNEIDTVHPRYFLIPKIGMNSAPVSLYKSSLPVARRLINSGFDFDVIDAHYFYPDGVAAVMLAQELEKPVVITARGSDLNLISQFDKPRRMIKWAADKADALITVCQDLKDVLVDLGVDERKVKVLRNGIDLEKFSPPKDRNAVREELGITRKTLLSVGNLVELKGHDLIINALTELPEFDLLIAGNGEERSNLQSLTQSLKLNNRVRFLGTVPHDQLRDYYGTADALVLASSREGWANVILESLACGTPVVATNVGGTGEVITSPAIGRLLDERSSKAIIGGVKDLMKNYPDRSLVREYAENFSWDSTSAGQLELFNQIIKTENK